MKYLYSFAVALLLLPLAVAENAEAQLSLPQSELDKQLHDENRDIFVKLSDETTVNVISNRAAPLALWAVYKYPYITNAAINFYRLVNTKEGEFDSIDALTAIADIYTVYASSSSPIVVYNIIHIKGVEASEAECYKMGKGDSRSQPITMEENHELQRKFFSKDEQGFYGMFLAKSYRFYGLPKLEKANISIDKLFDNWKSGKCDRIEYLPSSKWNDSRYTLLRAKGGGKQVFWYSDEDKRRVKYVLSDEQWKSVLATRTFTEIRFFPKSDEELKSLSFRCDIDWDNSVLTERYLSRKLPLN